MALGGGVIPPQSVGEQVGLPVEALTVNGLQAAEDESYLFI